MLKSQRPVALTRRYECTNHLTAEPLVCCKYRRLTRRHLSTFACQSAIELYAVEGGATRARLQKAPQRNIAGDHSCRRHTRASVVCTACHFSTGLSEGLGRVLPDVILCSIRRSYDLHVMWRLQWRKIEDCRQRYMFEHASW